MSRRCLGCMELFGDEFEICPHCGYIVGTHAEEAIHMEPGTILHDRYIIGKILGYGGFGITYIGWDGKLEQKVAIKEYLPGEFSTRMPGQSQVTVFNGEKSEQFHDGLKKFIDEAKRLAKFQNEPGIVKIFDSFEENETAYIIMEYLDGETLTDYLKREKTIPEDQAVNMLLPVMNSLQSVHAEGLLHRDIAPDNIFLTKTGEVKLIDFGASRYATTSHSRSLTVIIKPGFSPEEQYRSRGDQGPYTDVYALAATLYKMITGKTPPDAMERRAKYENQNKDILEEPHKLNKEISVNREVAILNAMNVRIEDRTPDVATFLNELNADPPAKRRYGKIKKIDVYSWPLWLKILVPSVLVAVVTFGTLLLTGVINFSHYNKEAVIPDNVVITPDVEGLQKDDAISTIEKEQLLGVVGESIESEYIQAGKIIIQTPVGGAFLEKNGTVMLSVSSGNGVKKAENGIATVPYLIGDTEEGAKEKLNEAGLGEPEIEYEYSDTTVADRVMSQDPEYGTEVEEGTQIKIVISKGSKAFKMINVVGKEADKAVKEITDLKLAVEISYEKGDEKDVNKVIKQTPEEGADVSKGTKVKIVVCTKSSVITVPDVVGKSKNEAQSIIKDKDLNVKASEDYSDSVPSGRVMRQSPSAGEGAKKGDTVVIVISKGARPAETTRTTQQTTQQTTKQTTKKTTKQTQAQTKKTEPPAPKVLSIKLDANGGTVSGSSISVTVGQKYSLPTPKRSYYNFTGWYTSSSGGTQVTSSTVAKESDSKTLYAQWTQKDESGWELASDAPANAKIVEQKWTYTKTETKESESSGLSGWTQTGGYWSKTGGGTRTFGSFPGGFNTGNWYYLNWNGSSLSAYENTTSKREVSGNRFYTYVYWHWTYELSGTHSEGNRRISDTYNEWISGGGHATVFEAFDSSTNVSYNSSAHAYKFTGHSTYSYWWETQRVNIYQQDYTDYKRIFQYKKTTDLESYSQVYSGGNISNVKKWVRYIPA